MSEELRFEGPDYYQLFDLLIDAAGKEWSESPTIILDGKRRSLHNAAAMISKELGYQGDVPPREGTVLKGAARLRPNGVQSSQSCPRECIGFHASPRCF